MSCSPPASSMEVKALMSAPAEKRKGVEGATISARTHPAGSCPSGRLPGGPLDVLPDLPQVFDDLRRDGVHLPVGEPGAGDTVSAGLELDDLAGLLGVGLGVGVEALTGLLPKAALGDEAAQNGGRGEAPTVALLRVLEALEDRVEPFDIGLHERRQQTPARIEAGAGHK